MSKHTPGPWKVIEREVLEDGSVYPRRILGGHFDTEVCQMEGAAVAGAFINDPAWKNLANSEIAMANANLIAVAPELLAALLDVQKRIKESDEWWMDIKERGGFDIQAIDAVIAKATGEKA